MPTDSVRSWGEAFMVSMTNAMNDFLSALPNIIGFLVILIVGWLLASLIARGVAALLRAVRFNEIADRAEIDVFIRRMGVKTDSAGLLALIVKWFVRLIALVVAFDALGLPAVSQVLREFLMWLPNLVVAIFVLVLGGLAAKAIANLVRGAVATANAGNPNLLARVAAGLVWAMAIVIAVNQLGIAETLVNTLFMAFVGALALGAGLAFGLGGRETAGRIVEGWYRRRQEIAQKARETAGAAGEVAREQRAEAAARTGAGQPRPVG